MWANPNYNSIHAPSVVPYMIIFYELFCVVSVFLYYRCAVYCVSLCVCVCVCVCVCLCVCLCVCVRACCNCMYYLYMLLHGRTAYSQMQVLK